MISKKEAKQRAQFFVEYLFGFKMLPQIELVSNEGMEDVLKEYADDNQVFEKRSASVSGLCMHTDEGTSAVDDCTIYINTTLCKTVDKFNSTLIHELLHYVLWWQGLDSDDGEKDFESRLKALGLSSNYDVVYEGKKMSKKPSDASKLKEYEEAYQAYKNKSSQPFEKECPVCGTVFLTTNKNRQYCDACKVHPEQKRRQLDQSHDKIKRIVHSDALVTYKCEYCGKEHTLAKDLLFKVKVNAKTSWDGNDHLYCCIEHRDADEHDHSTCSCCGKSLKGSTYAYSRFKEHNYCSDECAKKHTAVLAELKGFKHVCQNCGKEFINKKREAYFCSQECAVTARRNGWRSPKTIEAAASAEKMKVTVTHRCASCGKEFVRTYKNSADAKFHSELPTCCSSDCFKKYWNKVREESRSKKVTKPSSKSDSSTSLCATCKVSYKDCERMQTQFRLSPKGARYNNNGILVECPKFCGG